VKGINGRVGIATNTPATTLDVNGSITMRGALTLKEQAEPADPADGYAVMWFSTGTGAGNDGDLMIKRTIASVVSTNTIVP